MIGSRFTHNPDSRYAPIEGEALAVAEALDRARYFVLGCSNLTIAVDHKPLLKIFGDRSLENIPNARLRNLKEKTLRYRFRMIYIPGAKHKAADTTSRNPTGSQEQKQLVLHDDVASACRRRDSVETFEDSIRLSLVSALNSVHSITWNKVKIATNSNPDFLQLLEIIASGIPEDKSEMPSSLLEFHKFRHELYAVDGVVIYKGRVVVPPSLRTSILNSCLLYTSPSPRDKRQSRMPSSA